MRLNVVLILVILGGLAHAQTKSLDKEWGMGPFTFGDDVSKWESKMKGNIQISFGQDYYIYTGQDLEVFYNLRVRSVNVGFYKDKLNYVDYYYRKLDDMAFTALLNQLVRDYGEPEKIIDPDDRSVLESYRWIEEKVILQLHRFSRDASNWDDRDMTVLSMETYGEDHW